MNTLNFKFYSHFIYKSDGKSFTLHSKLEFLVNTYRRTLLASYSIDNFLYTCLLSKRRRQDLFYSNVRPLDSSTRTTATTTTTNATTKLASRVFLSLAVGALPLTCSSCRKQNKIIILLVVMLLGRWLFGTLLCATPSLLPSTRGCTHTFLF